MATIACPTCAQPVDDGESDCPNCGQPLATEPRTSELPTAQASSSTPPPDAPIGAPVPAQPRPPRAPSALERFVADADVRPALLAAVASGGYLFTKDVAGSFSDRALGIVLSIVFGLVAAAAGWLGTQTFARRRDGFVGGFTLLAVVALIANIGLLIAFVRL